MTNSSSLAIVFTEDILNMAWTGSKARTCALIIKYHFLEEKSWSLLRTAVIAVRSSGFDCLQQPMLYGSGFDCLQQPVLYGTLS